jgi:hypothetical protein
MNTVNIGILGGGTASAINIVAILHCCRTPEFVRSQFKANITCIHNPDIPIQQVGESVTPTVVFTLMDALQFSMLSDLESVDGTIRFGARYFWKDANGKDFDIPFTSPGVHVNSEKFSYWILDKTAEMYPDTFTQVKDTVVSYTQDTNGVNVVCEKDNYNFDFIIDCTGMPKEFDNELYKEPEIETVNSVILYPDFKKYDEVYTSSHVHENGWMFGVPLHHRKAWGYLYNNKITSVEDATKHFGEWKDIDASSLRKISWKHYYRKKVLDSRVLFSGNKLYFFEPHMTLPLHFYNMIATDFISKILRTQGNVQMMNREINSGYKDGIEKIQDLVALNYAGQVDIDSPFWKETNAKAKQRLINSDKFQHWITTSGNSPRAYFVHPSKIMREYVEGYNLDLGDLKRKL